MQDVAPPSPSAAPTTQHRPSRGHFTVALTLLTFVALIGGTFAAWWRVAPRSPSALERYFPYADGAAWRYNMLGEAGAPLTRARSAELLVGNEAGSQLSARLLTRALALTAGGDPADDDDAMLRDAQRAAIHLLRVARLNDTSVAADGTITQGSELYLILAERAGLMELAGSSFDPPLPIVDLTLEPGETLETRGVYAALQPYTATLTLEAREALTTPAGAFTDCLRTRLTLAIGAQDGFFVNWFCDGVGIARQEARQLGATVTHVYELAGASTPALLVSGEPPAVLMPELAGRPRGPGGAGAMPALPADELAPLWLYRERGANVDVTSPPLAIGDLLIFGMANGGLVALDRATHTQRWRFQAGGAIVGAPVVASGVLYVGTNDRKLYALDAASGAFRWAFATRDAISATPEVVGETVYVGSEDRNLYALDTRDGHERWRFTAGDAIVTAPRFADGLLFFGADDGVLYALDGATGEPRWAFSAVDAITSSPLVRDGVVYVGSHDGSLYALRAASADSAGALLWSYDAEEVIQANLALDDERVYLATVDGSLHAVDARTGEGRWRVEDGAAFDGAPLVAGDRVLIAQDVQIRAFAALDGRELEAVALGDALTSYGATASLSGAEGELFVGRASGVVQVIGKAATLPWASRPAWSADDLSTYLREASDNLLTAPAVSGVRLAGVSAGGLVYSVSQKEGALRTHGRLKGEAEFSVPPAADERTLYAIDADGVLIAYDLGAGKERWRAALGGRTRSAPALFDGRVLVAASGDAGTTAYAFDAASGAELWRRRFAPSPTGAAYTVLADGRFFVTAGSLYALDAVGGDELWSSEPALIAVQVAADGDTIYSVAAGADGWRLAAWEGATGKRRLSVPLDAPTFPNLTGGMAAGDGAVAVLLADRTLLAIDAQSGAERWRLRLGAGTRGAPAIVAGLVLVEDQRNHLLAYTAREGRLAGDFALIDDTSLSDLSAVQPLVQGDRVYATFYQSVAALRLVEGSR